MYGTGKHIVQIILSVFILFVISAPRASHGSPEKLIVKITVNSEAKGDFLVHLDAGEDFLVRPEDLAAWGINALPGKTVVIEEQAYQSLRSLTGITSTFDKKSLTLHITSAPSLLRKTVIDLAPPGNLTVYYPRENSAFLNYGLTYHHREIMDSNEFALADKLGIRSGDLLFLTDSIYNKTDDDSRFVRLMSTVTYERRGELHWFVAGDSFASSGELGSTINIGGIGFSKIYRIDPYFIKQPMFSVSGVASLPSEASVYLDGMLIRTEKLSPGEFDLNNLNYYGGARLVEIVLKDAFGNEQRVVHPFYFTDALLKKGLHEYSYNAGFLREQFGVESNEYGDAAFSAFHRYGFSNALTLGARAEATRGTINIGPQASLRLLNAGLMTISLAASRDENDETGHAQSLSHTYQNGAFATRLFSRKYSEKYATIQSRFLPVHPKSEIGAGVSYSLTSGSALSLDYLSVRDYAPTGRDVVSGTYTRTITNKLTGFATVRRIEDMITGTVNEFFVGISMTFDKNTYGSSLNRYSDGTRDNVIQVYRNITGGEGLSYRGSYESHDSDSLRSDIVSPYAQYNGRYGIYAADYSYQRTNGQIYNNYTLSASGAAVYAGGFLGLTRPINDSFSIVKIDGLKDVKVSMANTEMGRTDSSGTLIIPEIKSYNYNQVSLDPGNIPMDYQLSNINVHISPSQWSGSCVVVNAKKIQAYTGTILLTGSDGAAEPAEMRELTMTVKHRTMRFLTGRGGEFYFENSIPGGGKEHKPVFRGCQALSGQGAGPDTLILPGTYTASFDHEGKTCTVVLKIVKSDDVIVDLGAAIGRCEEAPARQGLERPAEPAAPAAKEDAASSAAREKALEPLAAARTFVIKSNFDAAGNLISSQDRKALAAVVRLLKTRAELVVEIEGHGGRHGSEEASARIGLKKAKAVKRYLEASGINGNRIKLESAGKGKLLCTEPTSGCDRMNRRIIVRLVKNNGFGPGQKEDGGKTGD